MNRPDVAGDVPASDTPVERHVIRRIGSKQSPAAEANPQPEPKTSGHNPVPAPRPNGSSIIRRIGPVAASNGSTPNLAASSEAANASPTSHPVFRRLLPASPARSEEERRRAIIRPLPRENPRSVPTYDGGNVEPPTRKKADVTVCRHCGSSNRAEAMFCSTCGGALPAVRGLPASLQRETDQWNRADHEREQTIEGKNEGAKQIIWRAAGMSNPGKVRENNEDSMLAEAFPGNGWLLVIADGMGGAEAGEVASSVSVALVRELVETRLALDSSPNVDRRSWLAEATEQANLLLHRHAEEDPALRGMGTTLVIALVQGSVLELSHVGDSRLYVLHPNGQLEQLTMDHSIVAHLVRIGALSPDEAESHPLRSQLYRAVATSPTLEADTAVHELPAGSKLLLCSDGLPLHVTDEEIAVALRRASFPEEACNSLIALALSRGGEDNVSVITLMQA